MSSSKRQRRNRRQRARSGHKLHNQGKETGLKPVPAPSGRTARDAPAALSKRPAAASTTTRKTINEDADPATANSTDKLVALFVALLTLVAATAVVEQSYARAVLSLSTLIAGCLFMFYIIRQFRSWIRFLTITSALLVTAAVAWLGTGSVMDILQQWSAPNAAAVDAGRLNRLHAGELITAFQQTLETTDVAVVRRDIADLNATQGSPTPKLDDRLYVLPTVYVEAFVNESDQTVDGYTITARTSDMPQGLRFLGHTYDLGRTTIADASLDGITQIGYVCAAHVVAYYEVSDTSEADLVQTLAVGVSSAGAVPPHFPACPFDQVSALQPILQASTADGQYTIDEFKPTDRYLSGAAALRRQLRINSISISAPGFPIFPAELSLHPMDTQLLDPPS